MEGRYLKSRRMGVENSALRTRIGVSKADPVGNKDINELEQMVSQTFVPIRVAVFL